MIIEMTSFIKQIGERAMEEKTLWYKQVEKAKPEEEKIVDINLSGDRESGACTVGIVLFCVPHQGFNTTNAINQMQTILMIVETCLQTNVFLFGEQKGSWMMLCTLRQIFVLPKVL